MRLQTQLLLALLCAAPSTALAQNAVGEVFATDASIKGSVVFASGGTQVLSGSQVAAGASAAVLKLQRGGDVRICPGTNLSVATSPSGAELMLSLSTGSLETNYRVSSGSDTVLTPDFRMQMIGPGVFHLAIAADGVGNTCVRPLASNNASVIVTELMGNATYQVKPGEEVFFPKGKIAGAQNTTMQGCGCPAPEPIQRAEAPAPQPAPVAAQQSAPSDTHVQMDAPFVFQGDRQQPPDIAYSVASLKTRGTGDIAIQLQPKVLSPQAAEQAAKELKKTQEAREKELAKEQELAREEQKKQEKLAAKQQERERKAQLKKDKATARELARANKDREKKEREELRQQQAMARREEQQQVKQQAAAAEQAKLEQKKREEIEHQRGTSEQAKSSDGVFKKIGSFFGRLFH
jgi:murein DD-endopeptidase MepM/ murein hydrolase activator NlpD